MLQGWLLPLLIETLSIFSPVTVYGQMSWFLLPKAFPYSSEGWAGVPFNVPNNNITSLTTQTSDSARVPKGIMEIQAEMPS